MKKLLKVSMVAMLVAAPFAANATLPAAYSNGSTSQKPTLTAAADVASTSYVKGAYDTAIGYINELNTAKLDASTAASTYATQTALSDGLATKQNTIDADHKLSVALVDGALSSSDAASTYETQAHASSTYATQTALADKLDATTAASTYATQTALSDGLATKQNTIDADHKLSVALVDGALSSSDAASTYETQAHASSTYATQTALADKLDTTTAASTYETQAHASSTYATQADLGDKSSLSNDFTAAQKADVVTAVNAAMAQAKTASTDKYVTVHTTWGDDTVTTSANVLTTTAPAQGGGN